LYTVEIPATERLPCNAAAMARLLYITNGLTGGLNANYELARRLAKAGHTVGFLGYGDVGDSVRGQGYSFIHVTQADRAMDQLRADLGRVGRVRAFPRGVALRRHVIGSREIEAAVSAARPDALIVDIEAHYSILATRSLGIPTVLKNDFFSLAWERGVPPMHSEQPYPRGRRDRVTADIAWLLSKTQRHLCTNSSLGGSAFQPILVSSLTSSPPPPPGVVAVDAASTREYPHGEIEPRRLFSSLPLSMRIAAMEEGEAAAAASEVAGGDAEDSPASTAGCSTRSGRASTISCCKAADAAMHASRPNPSSASKFEPSS